MRGPLLAGGGRTGREERTDGRRTASRALGQVVPLRAAPAWQVSLEGLQRTAGNAAVTELLSAGHRPHAVFGPASPFRSVQLCGGDRPCDCAGQGEEIRAQRATPAEFAVRDTPTDTAKHTNLIFFDMNSATLDGHELAKIPSLATPALRPLTLRGTASEEGPGPVNTAIVDQRIDAVADALTKAGWAAGPPTKDPQLTAGAGNIDYRGARSVEVRATGTPTAQLDCSLTPDGAPNDCGPDPNPFTTALDRAEKMVDAAIANLSSPPLSAETAALLDQVFGGAGAVPDVSAGLTAIKDQLKRMPPFTPTHGHRCVNNCDSTCGGGAVAYNDKVGAAAMMTLCQSFMAEPDLDERASTLIHEGSHGTPGLETDDKAYQWQRLFSPSSVTGKARLPTAIAVKNADSIATFVRLVNDPGAVTIGPSAADADVAVGWISAAEQEAATLAVAWVQQWMVQSAAELSSLYGTMKETMKAPLGVADPWTNGYYEETMELVASRFGLTHPTDRPTMFDRAAVAGIFDRFDKMERTVDAKLVLEKVTAQETSWTASGVKFGKHFFALTAPAQANLLLRRLIALTASIPVPRRNTYFKLVHDIVDHGQFGSP